MKLILRSELAGLSVGELRGLYRRVFNDLVQSERGSIERLNALVSLDNIAVEIAVRDLQP